VLGVVLAVTEILSVDVKCVLMRDEHDIYSESDLHPLVVEARGGREHSHRPVFAMMSVHSITKMYRTSTISVVHATLHFVHKSKVYTVHFVKNLYTLI